MSISRRNTTKGLVAFAGTLPAFAINAEAFAQEAVEQYPDRNLLKKSTIFPPKDISQLIYNIKKCLNEESLLSMDFIRSQYPLTYFGNGKSFYIDTSELFGRYINSPYKFEGQPLGFAWTIEARKKLVSKFDKDIVDGSIFISIPVERQFDQNYLYSLMGSSGEDFAEYPILLEQGFKSGQNGESSSPAPINMDRWRAYIWRTRRSKVILAFQHTDVGKFYEVRATSMLGI